MNKLLMIILVPFGLAFGLGYFGAEKIYKLFAKQQKPYSKDGLSVKETK